MAGKTRAMEALEAHKERLLRLPNVIGVGRGIKRVRGQATGQEAVLVMVRKKMATGELSQRDLVPQTLDGVPTDIIEVGNIQFLEDRRARYRPAPPGVSIGHYRITAGTFGALVKDKDTGELLILSNNHVLANRTNGQDGRAAVGDPILQPGVYDGGAVGSDTIAELVRFVPLNYGSAPATCNVAQSFQCLLNGFLAILAPGYSVQLYRAHDARNLIDAACARPSSDTVVIPDILEIGQVKGVKEASIGMPIKKSGRTTGLTRSTVEALDVTIQVGYGNGDTVSFEDQILSGAMAEGGDSGSLVLTEDNYAVGLLFAGSDQATVMNRIQNVMRLLNVTF